MTKRLTGRRPNEKSSQPRILSLSPEAFETMDMIKDTGGNMSAYVSAVLERETRKWLAALERLRDRGWTKAQIRSLIEYPGTPTPGLIGSPRHEANRLTECDFTSQRDAMAVLILLDEARAGNSQLLEMLS